MLIVLGGLPGVGKTTIARELARQIGAVHLRIDSIEEALRASGTARGPMDDSGYRVAYAIAEDNLRVGRTVIADSVNPLPMTRNAWVGVAKKTQSTAIEFEIICSDLEEHSVASRRERQAGLERRRRPGGRSSAGITVHGIANTL